MADLREIDRTMKEGIYAFLVDCTVPLIAERDGRRGIAGTGTLFRVAGITFLVTAAHVARSLERTRLYFPLGDDGARLRKLNPGMLLVTPEEVSDVGALRLEARVADELVGRSTLTLANVGMGTLKTTGWFFVCGYPEETTDPAIPFAVRRPLALQTRPYSGSSDDLARALDQEREFLLEHPAGVRDFLGEPCSVPRLTGMSGCSIWVTLPDGSGVWSAERMLRVVGIQTSVAQSRKWIRATTWGTVARLLYDAVPETRPEIEAQFGPMPPGRPRDRTAENDPLLPGSGGPSR
jgi:hypothetical protein